MPNKLGLNGKKLAQRGMLYQLLFAGIAILFSLIFLTPSEQISVIVGALIFILPMGFFAYWVFRYAGATKSKLVVQSFSQAAKIKLAMSAILFVIAFRFLNAHPLPLFGAYAVTMMGHWLAMIRLRNMS